MPSITTYYHAVIASGKTIALSLIKNLFIFFECKQINTFVKKND
ncbi:hypothetical protein B0I10_1106 [Flavobacterium lacus]|uniref:Uncharacterized protein n=1 Tax=Flavobacterium lacus TaxID=1353778 RepID=A0A328WM49_9FLAO|nr:hypothetical protein B0I10_1106 [Flavobacterium lacus]